jgi:hypothetical protein
VNPSWIATGAYELIPYGALFAQQGAVYLRKLADVPDGAQQITPRLQLVPGISMKTRHRLDSVEGVKMYTVENSTALDGPVIALSQPRTVTDSKHGDICGLPAGAVFKVIYQQPIYKAEQSHTGGSLCNHNHRTRAAAERCLPRPPHGDYAYSMAGVRAVNDAARQLDDLWRFAG